MNIEIVNPAEWIPRITDLLNENWAETGFDFSFSPDIAAYQRLWDFGMCFAIALFDGEKVAGYCTVMVVPHPHNPHVVVGSNDALFVSKDYRKGSAAFRLIAAAEQHAKAMGASRFTWHCRAGTTLDTVLKKRGYQPADIVVMKEI